MLFIFLIITHSPFLNAGSQLPRSDSVIPHKKSFCVVVFDAHHSNVLSYVPLGCF